MKKIMILLIEDNRLLRDGIASMLTKQSDMHVAASFDNGDNLLPVIGRHKPNILLFDFCKRNHNSLQIIQLTNRYYPDTKIIMTDLIPLYAGVLEFVRAGVSGFILKDASVPEYYKTIRLVFNGAKVLPPQLTASLFSQIVEHAANGSHASAIMESVRVTKRERQVIKLISDYSTNKEIAQKLHISTYTVKSHIHNILEKLALNTRVQIATHAHLSDLYKTAVRTTSFISE